MLSFLPLYACFLSSLCAPVLFNLPSQDAELSTLMDWLSALPDYDENELYQRSLVHEPREETP